MEATIREKLEVVLKPSRLGIKDFSDGCGLKFRLVIVSDSFDNKTTLASHRLVYDVLKEEMQAIHALEITTYTPQKWSAMDESEKRKIMFVYQLLKCIYGSLTNEVSEQPAEEFSEKLAAEFESACSYLPIALSRGLISRKDRLHFYARYKRITCGRAALSSMSTAEAMRQYVARLVELNIGWDGNHGDRICYGVRPSTMVNDESVETESAGMSMEQIEWFDALNEGNIEKLKDLLAGNRRLLEERDDNQLTALHWVSDRGKFELVEFLVYAGAHVNSQDYGGQTPLHYAVSCSHRSVSDFLLQNGADPAMADFEGNCPLDIVTDTLIRKMLEDVLAEKSKT